MIPSQLKGLIDDLSSCILQTNDFDTIERARTFGYFLLRAPSKNNSLHDFDFWANRWKSSVKPSNIVNMINLKPTLPAGKFAIYTLLDSLKRSSISEVSNAKIETSPFQSVSPPMAPILSNEQIIPEILKLLRGGKSSLLNITDKSIDSNHDIGSPDANLIKRIYRIILCLKTIRESRNSFIGEIAESMRMVMDEEYHSFIEQISKIDDSTATFISIFSVLSGQLNNRIYAATIICEVVKQSPIPSIINSLLYSQNYGLHTIRSLGSKMIDAGITVLLRFIRDWTVYGVLEDKYSEFFISKNKSKVDSGQWWSSKFVVVDDLVPKFLIENQVVKKILTCGRVHNFLRKYRDCCSSYVANFGSTAPFAVNFEQPKAERVRPEIAWKGPPFELSMVDIYAEDTMESLMYMMMKIVWIPGHLKVAQDFLLFARGDFAAVLYQSFNETVDGDPPSLLLHSIQSITDSKIYSNSLTHEILTDRIDMQKKWSIQPTAPEALITYLVNPPIDAFLGKAVLKNYDLIGQIIWKLKCAECQLGSDWQNARRLQMMQSVGFKSRRFCLLRHLMFYSIRTILEYISTDVIILSWKSMEEKMEKVNSFDELFSIHNEYITRLLTGTFQTSEYSLHNLSLHKVCDTIHEFTDIEQELETIYTSIINQVKRNRNWKQEGNPFFVQTIAEIAEINKRFVDLYGKFNEQIGEFYLLSFDNMHSLEMQQLEVRLRSCVENIQ